MGDGSKKILVLGLGGAGCSIVDQMAPQAPAELDFVAMDCDAQSLALRTNVTRQLLTGKSITDGWSSGGDLSTGRRCAQRASEAFDALIEGVDLLLVVVGLGGGFGGGAAPIVARLARSVGAHTIFFTLFPFKFEGSVVCSRAQDSLRRLRTYADAIVQVPNSQIQVDGDDLLKTSMDRANEPLTAGVIGLWRLLNQTGEVCNLDYATLHTMLRHCDASCRFSCASATGSNRAQTVLRALRDHPLAEKGEVFKNAQGLIVGIIAGDDLRLSEVRTILEGVSPEQEESWVRMGIASDPSFAGRIDVILLAAESWRDPLVDRRGARATDPDSTEAAASHSRAKAFGGAHRTILKGQDYDEPTYARKNIKLPR